MLKVKIEKTDIETNKKYKNYYAVLGVDIKPEKIIVYITTTGRIESTRDKKLNKFIFKEYVRSDNKQSILTLDNFWIDGELIDLSYKEDENV